MAALLSADVGLVHFHDSLQFGRVLHDHRLADSVRQIPSGPVLDAKSTLQPVGGDSLFRFGNQRNGEKPLVQGRVRVMVDGAGRGGELEAAFVVLPEFAIRAGLAGLFVGFALSDDPRDPGGFAGEALDAPGPAHVFQKREALFFGVKLFVNV